LPGFEMDTPIPDADPPEEQPPSETPSGETLPDESSSSRPGSSALATPAPKVEMRATEPPASLQGKTVWVIDSHSLIYQVFHAVREMTGPAGQPVAAVYGFTRDMIYVLEQKKPDYLFCAFDMPGKTFRHEMYDEYKMNRKAMPEDLVPQIASVRRMLEAFNIPALGVESFEADDILATMASIVDGLGGECVLVTSDKDCRQLITDRVTMYNIRKDESFDRDSLAEVWGISPEQVVDFQALVGDSSDNVPGVPLIGPKFAQQLLEKYGTLDEVLDHAEEVSGKKRKENLLNYRDQAELSRRLVRLDANVPVPIDWEKGQLGGGNRRTAEELFDEFGFRSMRGKLKMLEEGPGGETVAATPKELVQPTYKLVDTPEALEAFVAELKQQTLISLDTETTDIRPRWAKLVGLSFAWKDDEAWYLPVRGPKGDKCLELEATLEALRPVLEDPKIAKIGQNLKYDMIVLRGAGVDLAGVAFDTMVASYLLDAGLRSHNLDDLASRYLDHTTTKISELIGTGKNQKCMDEVPVALVCDYAGEDALLPLRLRPLLAKRLEETECRDLFDKLEIPLIDTLVEMEYNGIKVDVERLNKLSTRYGERIERLREEIYELAGREFNVASPKQLQEVLFEELELPVIKQTAKTGPSTDAEVLEELASQHPLPAKLLEFRKFAKLKNTYVDALPEMVNPETGRVHASFNQVVAATGRLSSSDPNLQNIPVRGDDGREIRSAFVPDPSDWTLLAADYSQIELRVLAHYSRDEHLCEAFINDEDIHARVASQIGGVPLDEVTKDMRWRAKAVNFGVIYGQGAFGLAKTVGIEKSEAAEFIDGYFEGYPGIEEFLVETLAKCRTNGYVSTLEGRRRAIQGVRESAGRQRNLAERTAVNTVIQGSAADLIKIAMVAIHRRLRQEELDARMLLQIHDELIFEVPRDQLTHLKELVTEEMVGAASLSVPLKVDVKTGPSWADAEPV